MGPHTTHRRDDVTTGAPPSLVFGVPIGHVDNDTAIAEIVELARLGRRRRTTHQVATVNVDFLVRGLDDDDVLSILRRSDLCIADGMPIVWAARAFGMPVPERVAGADLVPRLIASTAQNDLVVHVFGSSPDVAARSEHLLRERYPAARFSIDPGPMISDPTSVPDAVLDSISSTGADILLVALGNPKQERFIAAHRDRLGVPVSIGIGGSLDMLSGERRRAPITLQRLGLEWVFRALQEPGRLGRRYTHDIRVFVPHLARELRAVRQRRGGSRLVITSDGTGIEVDLVDDTEAGPRVSAQDWSAAAAGIVTGARSLDVRSHGRGPDDRTAASIIGLLVLARRHGLSVTSDGFDGWPAPLRPVAADLGL